MESQLKTTNRKGTDEMSALRGAVLLALATAAMPSLAGMAEIFTASH